MAFSHVCGWIWACDSSLEPSYYKNDHIMGENRFARAARPQGEKMRSDHYIGHFKTTVLRLGPLK